SDAVVCSKATRYARSPLAPAATTSISKEAQSENRDASQSNVASICGHPMVVTAAPNSVTGSVVDHGALRGPASPLWSAVSAAVRRGSIDARTSSVSATAHLPRTQSTARPPEWARGMLTPSCHPRLQICVKELGSSAKLMTPASDWGTDRRMSPTGCGSRIRLIEIAEEPGTRGEACRGDALG